MLDIVIGIAIAKLTTTILLPLSKFYCQKYPSDWLCDMAPGTDMATDQRLDCAFRIKQTKTDYFQAK